MKYKNVIYLNHFNDIGGVETFVYEIAKKYGDRDITIIYQTGHPKQIERIRKYLRLKKWNGKDRIECELLILNYTIGILPYVKADKVIQIIHAMYKTNKLVPHLDERISEYYAVSKIAANEFKELTGIECKVASNPITILEEDKKKVLWLISATRLSWEKGKENMEKLGNRLNRLGIPYIWLVYTTDKTAINNPNIIYRQPTLDIRPIIHSLKGKGYGVQLSLCEGDCIFTKECRALGLPTIVTPVPAFKEQGIKDGINGYILPYDINDATDEELIRIYENIPEVEETTFDSIYDKILINSKNEYKEELKMKCKIRCIANFFDIEAKKDRCKDDEWIVSRDRADYLIEERQLCELVEVIKEDKKEDKKKPTPKKETKKK